MENLGDDEDGQYRDSAMTENPLEGHDDTEIMSNEFLKKANDQLFGGDTAFSDLVVGSYNPKTADSN